MSSLRRVPLISVGSPPMGITSRLSMRFPARIRCARSLAPKGYALTERLCVYPQYMDPEWMEQGVLDVIKLKYWSFIPRKGSGRRSEESIDEGLAPGRSPRVAMARSCLRMS